MGSYSAIPIPSVNERRYFLAKKYGKKFNIDYFDITEGDKLFVALSEFRPDVIVHLAEMPSAPYSMIDTEHAIETHHNNLDGTLNLLFAMRDHFPDVHLVKLGCYDDETEILTEDGWKYFRDLDGTEKVATRTEDNRLVEFKIPKKIYSFNYNGDMYQVQNNRLDMLLTPNHRIFTVKRSNRKYGPLRLESVADVSNNSRVYDIGLEWVGVTPKKFKICGRLVDPVIWLRFLGWFLSEGCVPLRKDRPNSYQVNIKQNVGEKLNVLLNDSYLLAKELGIKRTITHGKHANGNAYCQIVLWGKKFATYMKRFGKSIDKHIPRDVLKCDKNILHELLDTLVLGDGWKHHRGFRYYSISKQLADDVQEVALKCGWAATINQKDGGFQVGISVSNYAHVNNDCDKPNDSMIKYNGKVHCVEIGDGHGIIFVRRNGKPFWSGNTMGEYGTPNIDIPEGEFDLEFRGRKAQVMFPRKPGSFYHATKVHDTYNIEMACRLWGLRSTDIMQGVVYGTRIGDKSFAPGLATRFDFDATFGTAINRFCAQAIIGEPITPYGNGHQKRGFLPLRDSMQCLRLIIENPPASGEYRTVNQFEDVYDITALAEKVQAVHGNCEIRNLVNPRMEAEDHYYNPDHQKLLDLGYKPTVDMITEIANMFEDLEPHKNRILEKKHVLIPDVRWDGTKKRMGYCDEGKGVL